MSEALMDAITLVRVMRALASYLFVPCEDVRRQQFAIQKKVLTRTRFPGVGNGNPFQYSHLENSTDREAWWATVLGVAKSQIQLSVHTRKSNFIFSKNQLSFVDLF